MSKKDEITELLNEGYSVKDIMDELDVSRSYVSNIKSKNKKHERDHEDSTESKDNNLDSGNERTTSRNSDEMEGSKEGMEEKQSNSETNNSGSMGGIKKVKKHGRKKNKESKENKENKREEETSEEDSRWNQLKKYGMKILLGLTLSILLVLAMLRLSTRKTETPEVQNQQFPMQRRLPGR